MSFIATAYAATEAVAKGAAEQAANSGGVLGIVGTLGLNGKLFLAQLINFAILAVALWYLLFKPLTRYMEARAARIAEGLENAKKLEEKIGAIEAERQGVLARAEGEGREVLTRAEAQASHVIAQAKQDAAQLMVDTRLKLEREAEQSKQQALADIRADAADLVVLAAEKVLREHIDVSKDKALIERALKEVKL